MLILYKKFSSLLKVDSVCDSSFWNSSSSALQMNSYSSPSSASRTEWPTSPVRSTSPLGQCLSGTRNCNPASCHTIPHDSRIPTPQKRVISLPLVFEIPLPALVFNSHPESCPQNKPDPASRQTYCGPSKRGSLRFYSDSDDAGHPG